MADPNSQLNPAPRFVVGIDLGTTNSAMAFVDTAAETTAVRDFQIPQIVAPGEIEARDVLPSFHYQPAAGEFSPGSLKLPWPNQDGDCVVGMFARDHGAAIPGRLVLSAKSWLSHGGVDRTAQILPWHAAADVTRLSPVEVTRRYLAHMRAAWDAAHPQHPLGQQDVMLTVPASFDEVARELTVEAARGAGLARITLLEEPQAAFYAWIDSRGDRWGEEVKAGQKILVCDVGGGTTDLTLIRVRPAEDGNDRVHFHRVAVGEHLILGGDNLDLALAHHVEARLTGGGKLETRQWGALVRACRAVKETLLGEDAPPRLTINLASGGTRLIGSSQRLEVTRDEVRQILLEGFLPPVSLDDRPAARRSGFQEFGLPYASDPAITRHLAHFLVTHRFAGDELKEGGARTEHGTSGDPARPDIVLFNGGLFESSVLRDRLIEVLDSWFSDSGQPWRPRVLDNVRLDLAVARGAAYYGLVRRGKGVRIAAGLARTYYVAIDTDENVAGPRVVCLVPAGVEEGREIELGDRTFELLIRQPVEFAIFSSSMRTTDPPGAVIAADPEQLRPLPPIRTVLQSGRKSAAASVKVRLHARLTEIGTLELWFSEVGGDRQWKLGFDVRSTQRSDFAAHESSAESQGIIDETVLNRCRQTIAAGFSSGTRQRPDSLVKDLEQASGMGRNEWPSSFMRGLWDALMNAEEGRRLSDQHEARWLNLAGFCLRPGYGLAVDDWRVAQMWKLYPARLRYPRSELVRAEWWILWRRLAGGLSAGQQQTLAQPLLGALRDRIRMPGSGGRNREPAFQFGPHETTEVWRCLGSLELLPKEQKQELGTMLLDLMARPRPRELHEAALWALGRIGARVPVYGPFNALLAADDVEPWLLRLMELPVGQASAAMAAVQMSRRCGDRWRDIAEPLRHKVLAWLETQQAPSHLQELVQHGGQLQEQEQRAVFGETLPRGLRIE